MCVPTRWLIGRDTLIGPKVLILYYLYRVLPDGDWDFLKTSMGYLRKWKSREKAEKECRKLNQAIDAE
jgi:hypothetical protein